MARRWLRSPRATVSAAFRRSLSSATSPILRPRAAGRYVWPYINSWSGVFEPAKKIGRDRRGHIVRQRSPRFASVHFHVGRGGQQFAGVRQRSQDFAGVAVSVAVKTVRFPVAGRSLSARTLRALGELTAPTFFELPRDYVSKGPKCLVF